MPPRLKSRDHMMRPKGRAGCWPRTRAAAHFSQMALALARFFAQVHHISARGLRGHRDLSEVLLIVAEEHGEEHLPTKRESSCQRQFLSPHPVPQPPTLSLRSPWGPWRWSNQLTQKAKLSLSLTPCLSSVSQILIQFAVCARPVEKQTCPLLPRPARATTHAQALWMESYRRDTCCSDSGEGKQEKEHEGNLIFTSHT